MLAHSHISPEGVFQVTCNIMQPYLAKVTSLQQRMIWELEVCNTMNLVSLAPTITSHSLAGGPAEDYLHELIYVWDGL